MSSRQKKHINTETSNENCTKQMQQSNTIKHVENKVPDAVYTVSSS